MNGLTATGVTVGICAGLWQLVSSHVGLSGMGIIRNHWLRRLLQFYAAGGGKTGLSEARRLIIPGWCGRFRRAGCRLAGLGEWIVHVLGERDYDCTLLGGSGLARTFRFIVFIPGGFLGMTLFLPAG